MRNILFLSILMCSSLIGFAQTLINHQFDGSQPSGIYQYEAKGGTCQNDSGSYFNDEKHWVCESWLGTTSNAQEPMYIFNVVTKEFDVENVDSLSIEFEYWSDTNYTFIISNGNVSLPAESDTTDNSVVYFTKLVKGENIIKVKTPALENALTQKLTFTLPTVKNIRINKIIVKENNSSVLSLFEFNSSKNVLIGVFDLQGKEITQEQRVIGNIYIHHYADGSKVKKLFLK